MTIIDWISSFETPILLSKLLYVVVVGVLFCKSCIALFIWLLDGLILFCSATLWFASHSRISSSSFIYRALSLFTCGWVKICCSSGMVVCVSVLIDEVRSECLDCAAVRFCCAVFNWLS